MAAGFWGKKIGMTQLFVGDKVVPVTAIDVADWVVLRVKTSEKDGYGAVQVGKVKDRYAKQSFSPDWIKQPNTYFLHIREIPVIQSVTQEQVGQPLDARTLVAVGDMLKVTGLTIGRGFQGVIKRHRFKGPPGSHGSCLGKKPGSSSSYRSQGRVIKGKRFPGHMGVETCAMKNLEVVRIEEQHPVVFVNGSVPGKAGTLLSIAKV
jgi:large subunit ribosomal protein L3